MKLDRAVVAYSGGLDTSIIIPWLKENYGCEVIAVAVDVGQGEELDPLEEKAIASGASKIYIEDVKDEFVREYVFPMLASGAEYEGKYLLGTSIARPLIAKKVVEVAQKEGCDALVHGCTGKGNDQVRFELTFKSLMPQAKIIAPWREWSIRSRSEAIDYAQAKGIPVPVSKDKPYSMDRNLWHISYEGGVLEDLWNEPKDDMYLTTVSPEKAPDTPEYLVIGFEKGIPVSINGQAMEPVALIMALNKIAGAHGVGRVDIVENRLVGMKSRGCYETPGGTVLYAAYKELEALVLDGATLHYKEIQSIKYAELVYNGVWWSPLREALDGFFNVTKSKVTGEVRLKLYKGSVTPVGRRSPNSLYSEDLATFDADEVYNQKDAEGFINLFGLPSKVQGLLRQEQK